MKYSRIYQLYLILRRRVRIARSYSFVNWLPRATPLKKIRKTENPLPRGYQAVSLAVDSQVVSLAIDSQIHVPFFRKKNPENSVKIPPGKN